MKVTALTNRCIASGACVLACSQVFSQRESDGVVEILQEHPSLDLLKKFADHSLECPAMYDQLREQCPVARVHMPFGGDAYLPTRHVDIVKAWTDPQLSIIQASDGEVPRREAGSVVGSGGDTPSLFSVSDARHDQTRRLVTQAFTVKAANDLAPRVEEVTHALIDAMERKGPPADLFEDYAIQTPMTVICEMLGVPREDEPLFRQWGRVAVSLTVTAEERQAN
jgi:cytochrome P450